MINKERPKSAVVERMGSSAAFAWQFCAVAKVNFRDILSRARVPQRESWLCLDNGNRDIAGLAVVIKSDLEDDYWQLLLKKQELAKKVHSSLTLPLASLSLGAYILLLISLEHTLLLGIVLATGKSFSTNMTLNPPLSKEFQGESR